MSTSLPTHIASIVLVALGGALGALARLVLGTALPGLAALPTGTLAANLLGCLALGFVAAKVARSSRPPSWLQQGVGVGFLGSFTSTSTFASEAYWMMASSSTLVAEVYAFISLAGGLALAMWGAHLGGGMGGAAPPSQSAGGEA